MTKFSYKDRVFKTDDMVEQMVFHFQFDGDIILKDSDEAHDQEEFWDNKKRTNQGLLDKINVALKEEFGKDPCKLIKNYVDFCCCRFENNLNFYIVEGNEKAQKKSLRNQFNF